MISYILLHNLELVPGAFLLKLAMLAFPGPLIEIISAAILVGYAISVRDNNILRLRLMWAALIFVSDAILNLISRRR
ncbi:hypothetical protein ACQKMD_20295 [Viridibacillus sp. NPDC096237]|uniref:hypothetical protein n=1 Tax=Viridibacillus sp. NPDC096237 TaxID=3390721 RepID=UPI003D07D1F6